MSDTIENEISEIKRGKMAAALLTRACTSNAILTGDRDKRQM